MTEPRPRLAFCSAMPPRPSGIADYSAVLLPALAERFEITLYSDPFPPADASPSCRAIRSLRKLDEWPEEDPVLYHIGNDASANGSVYRAAIERPGIVVLHEYMLHHLVRHLALQDGGSENYLREMAWAYGAGGEAAARRFLEIGISRELWGYPLFERLLDSSVGVIVHNRFAQRRVRESRPDARVFRVPHLIHSIDDRPNPEIDRPSLGLPSSGLIVGCFGFITATKRPDATLRAFAALRRRHADATLVFVGETSTHADFEGLLHGDLGQNVLVTGRVGIERFQQYMQATDVAVNLRYPTGGETSGTLMRLMSMGKPSIVSRTGSFEEIPEDCCIQIAPGRNEELDLLAAMLVLAEDPALRRAVGFRARDYVEAHHAPEIAVAAYEHAILTLSREGRGVPADLGPLSAELELSASDVLATEIGGSLFDLGLAERSDVVDEIARVLTDLGLD